VHCAPARLPAERACAGTSGVPLCQGLLQEWHWMVSRWQRPCDSVRSSRARRGRPSGLVLSCGVPVLGCLKKRAMLEEAES